MFRLRWLVLTLMAGLPAHIYAQSWEAAVARGDYAKAADALHVVVTGPETLRPDADPRPVFQLAEMYARGLGVPQQTRMACTLFQMAYGSAMIRPATADLANRAEQSVREQCDRLTDDERRVAVTTVGCFWFGLESQTLDLAGQHIVVRPGEVSLEQADSKSPESLTCAQQFALARATTIEPPPDRAPGVGARHFVEIFSWVGVQNGASFERVLNWQAFELRAGKLQRVPIDEDLLYVPGDEWPRPGLPPQVESGLTLQMIRSGHVRWRFNTTPSKHGWFLLPDQKAIR